MVTLQEVQAAHYRHARHYLEQLRVANEVFQRGGERVWQSLDQLQHDWDQIERGQSWAAQHAEDTHAANLCSDYPLAGSDVLALQHTVADRIAWLEAALTAAVDLDIPRAQCAHLCALGRAQWEAGEPEPAKEHLERALALAEQLADPAYRAEVHFQLGAIAEQQSDLATANHHTQMALDLHTDLNDQRGVGRALWLFAAIRGYEANFDEALRYAEKSLEQFRAIDYLPGMAQALVRSGSLAGIQSNNMLAEQYYREGHEIYLQLGDLAGQGLTSRLLGNCVYAQGDLVGARKHYAQSLVLYQRLGNQHGIGTAHINLGNNAEYMGDFERAYEHYQAALAIFKSLQTDDDIAQTLVSMSSTVEELGQVEQAIDYALQARDIYRELGNQRWLAFTLGILGAFARERDEFARAESHLTEGLLAAKASGDPWVTTTVYLNWSTLEHRRGALDKARDHWCQAFDLALEMNVPPMLVESIRYLIDVLISMEELELAYELIHFVVGHPAALDIFRTELAPAMEQLDTQLADDVRQAAIARAQSRDLDAYCDLLQSECGSWRE